MKKDGHFPFSGAATGLFRKARLLARYCAPLFETRCASCAVPVPAQNTASGNSPPLCPPCAAALARREAGFCSRCGNIMERPDIAPAPCGDCLTTERPWDRFYFHAAYQGLLRDLLLRFKNRQELPLARLLGVMLAAHPGLTGPYDCIIPLPLHEKRLRERGFNQAVELAKPVAERLGAPVERSALLRASHTRPQAGLSFKDRKANVRNAFVIKKHPAGQRILLLDDIATTCASLEAAARTLRDAGAVSVDVAVVARTPEHSAPGTR